MGPNSVTGAELAAALDVLGNLKAIRTEPLLNVPWVSKQVTYSGANDNGALSAAAALTTALAPGNSNLVWTAVAAGIAGNLITIEYYNPGTSGAALSVITNGNAIRVSLATAAQAAASGVLTSNNTNVSNADTVTIGLITYTFKTALTERYATAVLTSDNTNVSSGDQVTIGIHTYTFRTALTVLTGGNQVPYEVLIGASADASLTNLAAAINGSAGAGSTYAAGTPVNTNVTSGAVSSHTITLTAITLGTGPNTVATTETSAHLSFGGATLSGGVNSIANEILIGGSADASLTNLAAAINGAAGSGTNYSSATAGNTQVSSSAVASHALTVTALTIGTSGNSLATTKSAATLSWGGSTLSGGVNAGTITSTASQISTAVNADSNAGALVQGVNAGGNNGSGVVVAMTPTALTGGSDGFTNLFTVSGDVLMAVIGVCQTSLAGATATLKVGFSGNTAALVPQFTATSLAAHGVIDSTGITTSAPKTTPAVVSSSQNVIATPATAAISGGKVNYYCFYIPLSAGATVTPAP